MFVVLHNACGVGHFCHEHVARKKSHCTNNYHRRMMQFKDNYHIHEKEHATTSMRVNPVSKSKHNNICMCNRTLFVFVLQWWAHASHNCMSWRSPSSSSSASQFENKNGICICIVFCVAISSAYMLIIAINVSALTSGGCFLWTFGSRRECHRKMCTHTREKNQHSSA